MKTIFSIVAVSFLCLAPALGDESVPLDPKDKLIVETVLRLKNFDLNTSDKAKSAVLRYLKSQPGTDQYFELIERFKPADFAPDLAKFCLQHATETSGVRGAELLFAMDQAKQLSQFVSGDDTKKAAAAVSLIGYASGEQAVDLLKDLPASKSVLSVRSASVAAMGRSPEGQKRILELVKSGKLPVDLKFSAANVLLSSSDAMIRTEAGKHLQLPATADARPLPPVAELIKRRGDATKGAAVFQKPGTCINCHKVRGKGKEVGPDLSEIGSKLSREAMFVSILDPSAAISHNYESYLLLNDKGQTITGLLISDTDESVTIRTREGIDRKVAKKSVEELVKETKSLMPQDLQKLLTVDQLVDVVEYLQTLKKPGAPK